MLIHPLAERLRALGMTAMADTFLQMQLDPAEFEEHKARASVLGKRW